MGRWKEQKMESERMKGREEVGKRVQNKEQEERRLEKGEKGIKSKALKNSR